MTLEFHQHMAEATRLTKSGNLVAATAAIQAALMVSAPVADARTTNDDVIDVQAWEVPPSDESAKKVVAAVEKAVLPASGSAIRRDTFLESSFSNLSGQRDYKLYVPPQAGDRPLPLVVMLHGCTQDADDLAAGTAMNEAARHHGFYVLYPVQTRSANPQGCWNWFKRNHQQSGRGEPSIVAGMTRQVIEMYGVDPQRVYAGGMSAGGAMAAILAREYPDLYAAAGVHSGLAPGIASDLPSALAAMKGRAVPSSMPAASGVPTIVFHGDKDATVHPHNAKDVISASAGSAPSHSLHLPGSDDKHASTKHVYLDASGNVIAERWEIHGAGHAWAGGTDKGSYTDKAGPNATQEMLRFFFERTIDTRRSTTPNKPSE